MHYPIPLNRQPMFDCLPNGKSFVPVAEKVSNRVVSLPISAWMQRHDLEAVIKTIREYSRQK